MIPALAGGVCITISLSVLAALAWRDPMRLRMTAAAKQQASKSLAWTPTQRRLLAVTALAPGLALAAVELWAAFVIWAGASLVSGWVLAQLFATRGE